MVMNGRGTAKTARENSCLPLQRVCACVRAPGRARGCEPPRVRVRVRACAGAASAPCAGGWSPSCAARAYHRASPRALMPTARRRFSSVHKSGLGSDYLTACQNACDCIAACIGISVDTGHTASVYGNQNPKARCDLNGEGMTWLDIAAAESASGVDFWGNSEFSGSGGIAGTNGLQGYRCYKKIGAGPGTPCTYLPCLPQTGPPNPARGPPSTTLQPLPAPASSHACSTHNGVMRGAWCCARPHCHSAPLSNAVSPACGATTPVAVTTATTTSAAVATTATSPAAVITTLNDSGLSARSTPAAVNTTAPAVMTTATTPAAVSTALAPVPGECRTPHAFFLFA